MLSIVEIYRFYAYRASVSEVVIAFLGVRPVDTYNVFLLVLFLRCFVSVLTNKFIHSFKN